jgi:hypothetical protein
VDLMESYIFYSHYDYSDTWPVLFGQSNLYLKEKRKILFTNKYDKVPDGWEVILYDDSLPYQQRFSSCLEKIDSELVILHHEDMFLHSNIDEDMMSEMINIVSKNKIDLIKLSRANYRPQEPLVSSFIHKNVYMSPLDLQFAIQPTIGKKDTFLKIYKNTPGNSIWEFEANASSYCFTNSIRSGMTFLEGEEKRGQFHWDSHIYPYFATAIVKGKWDFESYPSKMGAILEKYNIDPNIRGKNA